MICVCCKSKFLFSQINNVCNSYISEEIIYLNSVADLGKALSNYNFRVVFFDVELFFDTAEFRLLSPNTKFIVIGSVGFEFLIEKAILHGASDFILCPDSTGVVLECL